MIVLSIGFCIITLNIIFEGCFTAPSDSLTPEASPGVGEGSQIPASVGVGRASVPEQVDECSEFDWTGSEL